MKYDFPKIGKLAAEVEEELHIGAVTRSQTKEHDQSNDSEESEDTPFVCSEVVNPIESPESNSAPENSGSSVLKRAGCPP